MPYREPHRTVRDRIIDLEIMKLELRKGSRPQAPLPGGDARAAGRRPSSPGRAA